MIRDGSRFGYGARYVWALDHMRRRFGASGWPVVQAAARVAFDLRAVSKAATGTREELARQGMLTRAVRVEPAPRGGWSLGLDVRRPGQPQHRACAAPRPRRRSATSAPRMPPVAGSWPRAWPPTGSRWQPAPSRSASRLTVWACSPCARPRPPAPPPEPSRERAGRGGVDHGRPNRGPGWRHP